MTQLSGESYETFQMKRRLFGILEFTNTIFYPNKIEDYYQKRPGHMLCSAISDIVRKHGGTFRYVLNPITMTLNAYSEFDVATKNYLFRAELIGNKIPYQTTGYATTTVIELDV